jgi:hypothetical protein
MPDVFAVPTPPAKGEGVNVQQIPNEEAYQWVMQKHYAHRMPCVQYAFGLFENSISQGVVTFGQPATPMIQKSICGPTMSDKVIELNRLVVDSKIKNASSILVSGALKLLPHPCIVVSYADEGMGHKGYIYQATNFLYTGAVTAHDSEYIIDGIKTHPRHLTKPGETISQWASRNNIEKVKPKPKHRYVYFLGSKKEVREMRKLLRYKVLPDYPKGDTKRYDASTEIPTQAVLF